MLPNPAKKYLHAGMLLTRVQQAHPPVTHMKSTIILNTRAALAALRICRAQATP